MAITNNNSYANPYMTQTSNNYATQSFINNAMHDYPYQGGLYQQQSYPSYQPSVIAANETAFLWGDPHIVGADGDKYDILTEGKFNLLEDEDISFAGNFGKFKPKGKATVMRAADLMVDGKKILVDANGKATVDGKVLKDQTYVSWGDDSQVSKLRNGNVVIHTGEYDILIASEAAKADPKNRFLNVSVSTGENGVNADGTAPTGLLGETFDADSIKQTKPQFNINEYKIGAANKPVAPVLPDEQPGYTANGYSANAAQPVYSGGSGIQLLFQQLIDLLGLLFR